VSNYPINPHPDWVVEVEETRRIPGWKENLLSRIGVLLGKSSDWATKVGFKKNEVQIQYEEPVNSITSYPPLGLRWVQFRTYEAQTKTPGTHVVRFGPDTKVLMALVKVPKGDGLFKWFLLARKKYQFASKELSEEFSRGWVKDVEHKDQGWKLFRRDFPGLSDNPMVQEIEESSMGSRLWEDNAAEANKISFSLIVVTLRRDMSKEDLKKLMVDAKLHQEYPDENPEKLDNEDLVSEPVVLEIEEAARFLNAHLEGKEMPLALFGENFSTSSWSRFLSLHGKQFLHLLPENNTNL
jgi:hypothetical protein